MKINLEVQRENERENKKEQRKHREQTGGNKEKPSGKSAFSTAY